MKDQDARTDIEMMKREIEWRHDDIRALRRTIADMQDRNNLLMKHLGLAFLTVTPDNGQPELVIATRE